MRLVKKNVMWLEEKIVTYITVLVIMMSKWVSEIGQVQYAPVGTGSTVRHPTPLGPTTMPRPPHTSALGVPGERIAANVRLGERRPWRGVLPGTDRSDPGK